MSEIEDLGLIYTERVENLEEAPLLLLERLVLGGAADAEFFSRLGRCAEAFKKQPMLRLIWLPKLQSAAESAIYNGIELWRLARPRLGTM